MKSVLVIDDNPFVADTLGRVLTRAGYRAVLASDGNAGVKRFLADRPDLVVTDLIMPNKEGIETIRELRQHSPDLPIIAMSGGATPACDFLTMAEELGATAALAKPFSNDELLTLVARLLAPEAIHRPTLASR